MAYIGLGSRMTEAVADTTGYNPGNWTNDFNSGALAIKVSYYEIYSMSVTGIDQVSTVSVLVNGQLRTTAKLFGAAEWDPSQPILMNPSDELTLAWDLSATGTAGPPTATIWLRYDTGAQPGGTF